MTSPTHLKSQELERLLQQDISIGNLATLMHLVKGYVGIGVLALPWALKHAGIVVGPVLLLAVGFLSAYCMITLVKSSRHLSRKLGLTCLDYGEVAFYSVLFGPIKALQNHAPKFQFVVNLFVAVTQFGVCCGFVVFISQNLRQVTAVYWPNAMSEKAFIATLWLPLSLLVCIRSLAILAWFSTFANITLITSLCMMMRYILTHLPSTVTVPATAAAEDYPIFFGTAIFAAEGVTILLPIENVMKNREDFNKIFVIAIFIITTIYLTVSVLGYIVFGSGICASLTLNLPSDGLFYEMVRILYSLVIFVSYALQFHVLIEIVWTPIEKKLRPQKIYCELITRSALVAATCVIAIAIPNIGDIYSLIGACVGATLQFALPVAIEMMTFHSKAGHTSYPELLESTPDNGTLQTVPNSETDSEGDASTGGLSTWTITKNVIILIFAFIGTVSGTAAAMKNIIVHAQNYSSATTCSGGVSHILTTSIATNISVLEYLIPMSSSNIANFTLP